MAYLDPTSLRPFGVISPILTNTPVPVSNSDSRWHPKITIYRLIVISTTISLGSGKAIATLYGRAYVSITIEWIAGVVVFTFLFVAGWFEDNPSEYPKFAWFFDRDLVRFIWGPQYYSSEERQRTDGSYALITSYRLLVSSSVFLFGMFKASLSYAGFGGAANVFEWILGVVITSMLYVVGLYERNPMNMMPYLFERYYDDQFYSGRLFFSYILLRLIKLAFAVGLSFIWITSLREPNIEMDADIKKASFPTYFTVFHVMGTIFLLKGLVWLFLLASIGSSLYLLWEVLSAFGRLTPFRKLTALFRRVFLWISNTILRQSGNFNPPTWGQGTIDLAIKFYRFMRRFGIHILVFTAAIVASALAAFYFFGLLFLQAFSDREGEDTTIKPPGLIFSMLIYAYYALGSFLIGIGGCFYALFSVDQVLRPFSQDLEDPFREKLVWEF